MGMMTICWGIVWRRTSVRKSRSRVGNLNLAKEYAPRAATKMGMTVEGMVTISEFRSALLKGAVGWFQAPRKPPSETAQATIWVKIVDFFVSLSRATMSGSLSFSPSG
jgi:hypothetical protein